MSSTEIEDLRAQNESLRRRLQSWVASGRRVYLVLQSYTGDAEVMIDSVWADEPEARARANVLGWPYGYVQELALSGSGG